MIRRSQFGARALEGLPLKPFATGIWIADGDSVSVAGFRYPTRIAVIRLANGGLFVWSPVALSHGLRTAVEALGSVRFIVASNTLHHLHLGEWQSAYPGAQIFAAPGLATRRGDLRFDGELGEAPEAGWRGVSVRPG